jgi:hypothetical protein
MELWLKAQLWINYRSFTPKKLHCLSPLKICETQELLFFNSPEQRLVLQIDKGLLKDNVHLYQEE